MAEQAPHWCMMPGDAVLSFFRKHMIQHLPSVGQPMVFNVRRSRTCKTTLLSVVNIVSERTPYLTLVCPIGKDGSSDHAVCVVDDLIFDARLPNALKLTIESFDLVCGKKGLASLGKVLRFCLPHGKPKRRLEREMLYNW